MCVCVQYIYGDVLHLCGKACHLSPSKMGSGGFGGWPSVASRRKVDGLRSLQVAPEQAHTVLTSTTFVIISMHPCISGRTGVRADPNMSCKLNAASRELAAQALPQAGRGGWEHVMMSCVDPSTCRIMKSHFSNYCPGQGHSPRSVALIEGGLKAYQWEDRSACRPQHVLQTVTMSCL